MAMATKVGDLGIPEVARIMGCTESTVRKLCETQRLSSYRLGKNLRVTREALDEYRKVRNPARV